MQQKKRTGTTNCIIATLCWFAIAGCTPVVSFPEKNGDTLENEIICKEPRPHICTMEYAPVCGRLSDGSHKTYSNGCTACADKNAVKYTNSPCP